MKNRFKKIIVFALALALLIGSAVGIAVSADDTGKVDIVAKNVIYGEKYYIAFAVDVPVENAGDVTVEYKVGDTTYTAELLDTAEEKNLYNVVDTKGTDDTADDTTVSYPVFATYGFAPNDLTDVVEVTAFLKANEPAEKTYEDYSIATYLYNMLFKHGLANATDEADVELRDMFVNLINFSASAQKVIDNNPDNNPDYVEDEILITDYGFIKVDSSVGSVNGTDSVMAPNGTSVTISEYLGAEEGFTRWALVDIMSGEQIKLVKASEAFELDGIYEVVPYFGVRGTGLYYNEAMKYTDETATSLNSQSLLITTTSGSYSFTYDDDSSSRNVTVANIDGDAALYMKRTATNDPRIITRNEKNSYDISESLNDIVVEFDIYFDSLTRSQAGSSGTVLFNMALDKGYSGASNFVSRSDGFYVAQTSATEGDMFFKLGTTNTNYTVELDKWYNIRIEYTDMHLASGAKATMYVNGEYLVEVELTSGTTASVAAVNFFNSWSETNGHVYVDNLYLGEKTK